MVKILGDQTAVSNQLGEVTQGLGFDLLPVDQAGSSGLENPVATIDFQNAISNPVFLEGRLFYDTDTHAVSYYNNISDVTINVARELLIEIFNNTGVTITNGQVCQINGAVGDHATVKLSQANVVSDAFVTGVATHDIEDNTLGYIAVFGQVGGINTSGFLEGDLLFVSADTAGLLVNEEQEILSLVGIVITSDVSDGIILMRPRGVINLNAITQVIKDAGNPTQAITTTPVPVACYLNVALPEINLDVTFTAGSGQFEAEVQPASIGASGFYEVNFSIAGVYSDNNNDVLFTLYINGSPTSVGGVLPYDGLSPGSAASMSFSAITPVVITNSTTMEIYVESAAGTGTVTYISCIFNLKRIGNA